MAGDIKTKYAASSALTVTALHSLSTSADWTAGWGSASVDNTTDCYLDYMYSFTFTMAAAARQAGVINLYVVAALNDTPTWPAVASGSLGTEGAITFTDTEEKFSACRLLDSLLIDATNSAIYTFPPTGIAQLFGGVVPPYHCLFVTMNGSTSGASLAASGSAVYRTPVYGQYT